MLSRFFANYPEYAGKTFLSVKGGAKPHTLEPDCSPENLRRSVDYIIEKIGPHKHLDLFECARVVAEPPVEEVMMTLQGLIKEGKFDHIGLSECSADTVRRANAVAPIAAVEIEVSPWSYEEETKKGDDSPCW
jgi:pyridoxine 4-dehydrogenase